MSKLVRIIKTIDIVLQSILYGCAVVGELVMLEEGESGNAVSVLPLMLMILIGTEHVSSYVLHLFLDKHWQERQHRRRYGQLVIGYFVLLGILWGLEWAVNGVGVVRIITTFFYSAIPLGLYYYWIGWREWREQK